MAHLKDIVNTRNLSEKTAVDLANAFDSLTNALDQCNKTIIGFSKDLDQLIYNSLMSRFIRLNELIIKKESSNYIIKIYYNFKIFFYLNKHKFLKP